MLRPFIPVLLLTLPAFAHAENWAQWRGPNFNGFTSEKNLPSTWSQTENVVWKADMPGPGNSTPIVWEDRVFVTANEKDSNKLWALCLSRANGNVLWKHECGEGFFGKTGNNGAAPSAICDGERVYFMFGTGGLYAYDLDGKLVWERNIQEDHGHWKIMWKWGGSPLLWKGKLYLAVLHSHRDLQPEPGKPKPASYLLCIDPKTGKDLWKHVRETDAPGESQQAYITPYPYESPAGDVIIIGGGDYLTGHDAATGEELWRSPTTNPKRIGYFRVVPSPVVADGIVTGYVPRGAEIFGMDANGKGQLGEDAFKWVNRKSAPDVCSPLVMDGRLYVLGGKSKDLSCVVPKTGEILWTGKLDCRDVLRASPTGADGKIYCMSMDGIVFVLAAGNEFKVLSRIEMGGRKSQSTIAAAHGQLFIRTSEALYCIGTK